ncbi:UNVERIFIED_CONTAM: hypothetical protein Slati_2404500 [Sesamum latifolium]|uniref:RNase H type-1 domain-containing protein n=1 Tax=Sesamum latifolium TaxID=2727402 RepID=A0AAW2WGB5_9LAMI
MDGTAISQGSAVGIVIASPQGEDMEFTIRFNFKASNNETEYEALAMSMRIVHEVGANHLIAYSDSKLIVKQLEGVYEATEDSMVQYLQQVPEPIIYLN